MKRSFSAYALNDAGRASLVVFALLCGLCGPAFGQPVVVPINGSRLMQLQEPATKIVVADNKIAEVEAHSAQQLLVTAKKMGQTNLTIWGSGKTPTRYVVVVELPSKELQTKINAVLPKEAITVESLGTGLVLSGQVSDVAVAERAKKMAESYMRGLGVDAEVLNFLNVRGDQQVQLRVKVAEVSRSYLRQLGLNFWSRYTDYTGGLLAPGTRLDSNLAPDLGQTGGGLQAGGTALPSTGGAPVPLLTPAFGTDAFGILFATQAGAAFPMSIALNLLQSKGLAKILSEPTLVAFSGQEGKFLSGGEFPVPIPQGLGQIGIEYKKYGVQLSFTPTVLADKTIHLQVAVIVSDKDTSGAVTIQGTSVPALSTRHSETTIRLKSGQSFAIAGLLQDKIENANAKIPLLGDIPVIGMLFRRTQARRQESELVILATADLVQPLKPGEVPPLPGEDEYSDPDSWSLFLMGWIDAEKPRQSSSTRKAAGPVGFSR